METIRSVNNSVFQFSNGGVTGVRVPPDYASDRTRGPRILGPPLGLRVRPDSWS